MKTLLKNRWFVRRIGKYHGRGGAFLSTANSYPSSSQQTPSPFELEISLFFKMLVKRIGIKFSNRAGSLCATCRDLKQNKIPSITPNLADLNRKVTASEDRYSQALNQYTEFPRSLFVSTVSWLMFILLMISDFYFLGTVFLVFLLSNFDTAVLAIGTIITVSFLPHFVGRTIKNNERTDGDRKLFIISFVAMLVGSIALSYLRTKFLVTSSELTMVSWTFWESFLSFLSIQMMIVIFFALIGFISGHVRPVSLSNSREALKASQKELRTLKKEFALVRQKEGDAQKKLGEAQKEMLVIQDVCKREMTETSMHGAKQLLTYRDANIRSRISSPPPCFDIPTESLMDVSDELPGQLDCYRCPIGNDFLEKLDRKNYNSVSA